MCKDSSIFFEGKFLPRAFGTAKESPRGKGQSFSSILGVAILSSPTQAIGQKLLLMWPLCAMVEKLLRMAGDENLFLSSPDSNDSSATHRSHSVDVPHVRQLFNWDCGLACVLMVLRTIGFSHCSVQDLEKICPTTSIWTVDLAYLLHEYSVSFSFFTVTLGANPEYSTEAFYKEFLESDLGRVDRLFEKAVEMGINIECRSLSGKEISCFILSGQYIFIALVNKVKLSQFLLEEISASGGYSESSGYTGHYIVICGYDSQTNEFEIRDPASPRKYERVSLECLDQARKSFGTDEDIILVSLNGKDGNGILSESAFLIHLLSKDSAEYASWLFGGTQKGSGVEEGREEKRTSKQAVCGLWAYYYIFSSPHLHIQLFLLLLLLLLLLKVKRFKQSRPCAIFSSDMAEKLNDGVFWLPADFLDDDLFAKGESMATTVACFPSGVGGDLNSPTGALTETESDEEDYMAGLTRRMASSFLDADEDTVAFPGSIPKVLAGSPQSTLCAVEGWSSSSRGSPNGPSQVSSPPSTPMEQSRAGSSDLLYVAAGQVMRMRIEEQEKQGEYQGRGLLETPKKPSDTIPTANASNIRIPGYFTSPLPLPTLQQLEFERLKQEQLIKQQIAAAWVKPSRGRRYDRPLGLPPSAWPPLQKPQLQQQQQQQPQPPPHSCAGMRAIFLNGSGSRKPSGGTGVFLPRRAGNNAETRKKPACSTVLVPAKVVHALNLNLDGLNANLVDHNVMDGARAAKRNYHIHHRSQPAEVRLPPQWAN
ncbi:hypothetical protein J5N97_006196 [Dioscorea zingiberensis]|uniref:Guanylyl cyclase n=1 Tax=Dioscorea zingiberensis TaxID=325984 RepID=A0A9D5HSK2_9LILI|nr:hypothetical protein J5N97_006196 [Dioscorea zingiberensis]